MDDFSRQISVELGIERVQEKYLPFVQCITEEGKVAEEVACAGGFLSHHQRYIKSAMHKCQFPSVSREICDLY